MYGEKDRKMIPIFDNIYIRLNLHKWVEEKLNHWISGGLRTVQAMNRRLVSIGWELDNCGFCVYSLARISLKDTSNC